MSNGPERLVARIYDAGQPNNKIRKGSGVLLSEKIVITCAHVVASSLNYDGFAKEPPEGLIPLCLPLLNENNTADTVFAKVLKWFPKVKKPSSGCLADFAVLELTEPLNIGPFIRLADWGLHEYKFQRPYHAFGYGELQGLWSHGQCSGSVEGGWIQGDLNLRNFEPGCSGGAVFDDSYQTLIGMIVAIKNSGYFISVSSFRDVIEPLLKNGEYSNNNSQTSFISGEELKKQQYELITDLLTRVPTLKNILINILDMSTNKEDGSEFQAQDIAWEWVNFDLEQDIITLLEKLSDIDPLSLKGVCNAELKQGLLDLHSYTLALSPWICNQTLKFLSDDGVLESQFKTEAIIEAGLATYYKLPARYFYDPETRTIMGKYAYQIGNSAVAKWEKDWEKRKCSDKLSETEKALSENGWGPALIAENMIQEVGLKVLRRPCSGDFDKRILNRKLKTRRQNGFNELSRLEAKGSPDSSHPLTDPKVCKILKHQVPELPVIRYIPTTGEDMEADISALIEDFYDLINEHC